MDPLKEMFNKKFYETFAQEFSRVDKNFNIKLFIAEVTKNLDQLSLNERMRNTSIVLKNHLPTDYKKTIEILTNVIPKLNRGYTSLVFPDFVGLYGHDDFNTSMEALKYFTRFGSSEFAIRTFLKNDFNKTLQVMKKWARDKNHHVRRLASEGSRPRLPWSFKIDEVIKKPESTREILEILNADTELYVKKSVANHLNDISKDNPDYMIGLISKWDKKNTHTSWIIKHASRTLIKKGNAKSLAVFDFEKDPKVEIKNFKISPTKIKLGEKLNFSFDIISKKNKTQKLVIDYVIHYKKASKDFSPKVFKLKEINLNPKQQVIISKEQLFKDFTTRKHHAGKHLIEIMVNGKKVLKREFNLSL